MLAHFYTPIHLFQQQGNSREVPKEIDGPKVIPFDRAEQEKYRLKLMEEERQREYNQVKALVKILFFLDYIITHEDDHSSNFGC